jgi:hypothetical protein
VEPRIEPEPSDEEREAILHALAEEPDPYASRWRRAGLLDELEELGEEP